MIMSRTFSDGFKPLAIVVLAATALLSPLAARAQTEAPVKTFDSAKLNDHDAAISGNPAATTFTTGTGWLGRTLGIPDDWGIKLGGLWLADTNIVAAGGSQPGLWTANSALIIGVGIDANKLADWRGGSFGFQFLQLNAGNTNGEAGSVQGYNSLVGLAPFRRSELYQAWYLQEMVPDTLQVRIGRSVPTYDFNNVMRPVTFPDRARNIASVSGLAFTPVFINTTLLGVLPGYYNPGDGVTVNFTPRKDLYINLGVYDGNNARGVQSAFNGPQFNGYWFNIAEIGTNWLLGDNNHPGQFAVGAWRQTGLLNGPGGITQDGTQGLYLFGSQQISFGLNKSVPDSSISLFYQFGINNAETLPVNRYYGAGITAFAMIGERSQDSMGVGMALSKLNPNLFARATELMFQAYYQAHLYGATFLQPTVSFIPTPGAAPNLPSTVALTMRLTMLF
ncbi:hypothetical protein BH11PSE3_BH11PSE3_27780 [soil metagenome]